METMSEVEEQYQNMESKLIKKGKIEHQKTRSDLINTKEYFFQPYLFVSNSNDNF